MAAGTQVTDRTSTSGAVQRISPIRWAALAASGVLGAALIVSTGMASALEYSQPDSALALMPWNATAHGVKASALAFADLKRNRTLAAAHARAALRRDATDFLAARTLGLGLDLEGKRAEADRAFRYSEHLTRRDLMTNLWFIEAAVAKDDAGKALASFDRALRTSDDASTLLFPVLTTAFDDPELVGPITALLAKQPAWGNEFLTQAFDKSEVPATISSALAQLAAAKVPVSPNVRSHGLYRLVGLEAYGEVRRVAGLFDPALQKDRAALRDTNFARVRDSYPFGWAYQQEDGFGSETLAVRADGPRKGASIYADAGKGSMVMRQLVTLPPGTWQLTSQGETLDAPAGAKLSWRVDCATKSGAKIGMGDIALNPVSTATLTFTVPAAGCAAQWISLYAQGGTEADGFAYVMKSIAVQGATQ